MAYQFSRKDRTVAHGLRRIAAGEIEAALAAARRSPEPLAPRVHTMRKAVKKLRGLIRLVRPVFADFAAENRALAEAGRGLSGLRDAEVMLAAFDSLAPGAAAPAEMLADARRPFLRRHQAAHDDAALAAALEGYRDALARLAVRAEDWTLAAEGFDALAPGLARSWDAARAAGRAARRVLAPEALHTWRKRVKDHWYQARLLRPIWPEAMDPHIAAADRLGELLGRHNDLSVLAALAAGDAAAGDAPEAAVAALRAAAAREQAEILGAAAALAGRLFAGSAECLTRRWRRWWKIWQDEE
jgi:CHAD domain-containing protein